jgi:hypothetical protein
MESSQSKKPDADAEVVVGTQAAPISDFPAANLDPMLEVPEPSGGFYHADIEKESMDIALPAWKPVEAVEWTAAEFIYHEKNVMWYLAVAGATLLLSVIAYVFTGKDLVAVAFILITGILFAFMAARRPRQQQYRIDQHGVTVGNRTHRFQDFKSFSLFHEDALSSISLMPLKRFMPLVGVYYSPEDEDKIVEVLGSYLPFDGREPDVVERLMRKVRF